MTFGIGWPIGAWLDCDFDWGNHNLIVWGRDHPRPSNWRHETSRQWNLGHTTVWRPDNHPGAVAANRGDRGWNKNPTARPAIAAVARPEPAHQVPQRAINVPRPTPAPVEHSEPISRPESNGAFIGIQSSRDTRTYSNRGQQSMQTITRSAPVSRPAPSFGGGGGNGHNSGQQRR